MERKRRSRGVYAFATPTPHYREMNAGYNLMIEQGRVEDIASTICLDYTLSRSGGGYNEEKYLEWSSKIYGQHHQSPVWSPDYWMTVDSDFFHRRDFDTIERIGKTLPKGWKSYVPVRWTTRFIYEGDIRSFTRYLIEMSGRQTVPMFYFAIKRINGIWGEQVILYARRDFLEKFHTGLDLINYYEMAVNLKKVYGFE